MSLCPPAPSIWSPLLQAGISAAIQGHYTEKKQVLPMPRKPVHPADADDTGAGLSAVFLLVFLRL
uniref:Uncharacterized protein n=1 Tax=Faecalibaculum rodentium TaxID=1702221 RepID=A0A140DXV1_9FIRM|nr:hypothetical protein AALO17_23440 [Faecalibaculum rodentium]